MKIVDKIIKGFLVLVKLFIYLLFSLPLMLLAVSLLLSLQAALQKQTLSICIS